MQRFIWLCLAGVLAMSGVARAQSVNVTESGTEKWVKARVKKAKAGEKELVRLPMAYQSPGWGCDCPLNFINSTAMEGPTEDVWLKPVYLNGAKLPDNYAEGLVVVAEGYFTGSSERYSSDGDPATMYEFNVTRTRAFQEDKAADAMAEVLLSGEEAKREVTRLSDAKPWLVLTKSIPLKDKALEKKKADALKKLSDAGYSGAEVLDSRQTSELNCCYAIVISGRYATEAEARTALKEVNKKFKGSYVKRGW